MAFNTTHKKSSFLLKSLSYLLVALIGIHSLSIHGLAENLIFCHEENGQIVLESKFASFLTIPSEKLLHDASAESHQKARISDTYNSHHDVPVTSLCKKEQQVTRFDSGKFLNVMDGILSSAIQELPRSRVYQIVSFIPPFIENVITTSIQTVVLLN